MLVFFVSQPDTAKISQCIAVLYEKESGLYENDAQENPYTWECILPENACTASRFPLCVGWDTSSSVSTSAVSCELLSSLCFLFK